MNFQNTEMNFTKSGKVRRWEENSDHDLDIQQLNNYNFYKDKIRTLEIQARISGK